MVASEALRRPSTGSEHLWAFPQVIPKMLTFPGEQERSTYDRSP
jgi:hypothetical protein